MKISIHIVIVNAGKSKAGLSPAEPKRGRRKLGILKSKLRVRETFDAPLPDTTVDSFGK